MTQTTHGRLAHATRGQLLGHVFVFVLGAFVVAAVLIVGYRAIANLSEKQCQAQKVDFANDVTVTIANSLARGRVRTHTFTLPCGADAVCFVQRSAIDAGANGVFTTASYQTLGDGTYSIIASSVESGEPASVWIHAAKGYTKVDGIGNALPIADFEPADGSAGSDGIRCFPGSDVTLQLEGTGLAVKIKSLS